MIVRNVYLRRLRSSERMIVRMFISVHPVINLVIRARK